MYDRGTNPDSVDRTFRLSRRSGLRLTGLGALLSVLGSNAAAAQDASPVASPDASCISDPAANSATAARWFTEVLNQKRFDILAEIMDPNVGLDPGAFSGMTGVAQVEQMLSELLGAFPDASYTIEETLVDEDRVVIRWTGTGMHAVDYAGAPATGETKQWSGIHFFQFECGLISGIWAEADLLVQLGLVEQGQATPAAATGASGSPAAECAAPTKDEMEGFAQAWHDVWTSQDLTALEEVVHADAVHHAGLWQDATGLPGIQSNLSTFFSAFPDLQGTLEDVVVDGDRVAIRYSATGTNDGSFFGAPPTGESVSMSGMAILRVACGEIVEVWSEVSGIPLWQQLGLLEREATPAA